jgi:hypothetical protein
MKHFIRNMNRFIRILKPIKIELNPLHRGDEALQDQLEAL